MHVGVDFGDDRRALVVGDCVGHDLDAATAMAQLRAPIDAFFDKVTVNAEDAGLRINRLRLLNAIKATLERVADFSKIEG